MVSETTMEHVSNYELFNAPSLSRPIYIFLIAEKKYDDSILFPKNLRVMVNVD